jgi:hypothetical protein
MPIKAQLMKLTPIAKRILELETEVEKWKEIKDKVKDDKLKRNYISAIADQNRTIRTLRDLLPYEREELIKAFMAGNSMNQMDAQVYMDVTYQTLSEYHMNKRKETKDNKNN